MTDEETGLLGRLVAYEQILAFLLARDFVERDAAGALAVAQSIVNAPKDLAQGAGVMDAKALQRVQQAANNMEAKLLNHALAMADGWRAARQT